MNFAVRRTRMSFALLAIAAAFVGSLWVSTARSEAAGASCGTFTVLHNDRIGDLSLPKGKYTVRVIDSAVLSCPTAISNFRTFLWDYDGKLPNPWRYKVLGVGQGKFFQRTNTDVAFTVKKQGSPAPTPGPTPGPGTFQRCPGTFQVLNNDRIGTLILPRGQYYVYASTNPALSCKNAEAKFKLFLNYPTGALPAPWKQKGAQFTNPQKGGLAFRVKQAS